MFPRTKHSISARCGRFEKLTPDGGGGSLGVGGGFAQGVDRNGIVKRGSQMNRTVKKTRFCQPLPFQNATIFSIFSPFRTLGDAAVDGGGARTCASRIIKETHQRVPTPNFRFLGQLQLHLLQPRKNDPLIFAASVSFIFC